MTAVGAIGAVAGLASPLPASAIAAGNVLPANLPASSFGNVFEQGLATMDAKVANADRMVAKFALDDSVPVHQVTIALEEARLSVEFAMQVRQRMVEAYKDLMNMQL